MALPLFGYTVLTDVSPITGRLASDPELSVFMKLDATASESQAVGAELRARPGVADVQFVSRDVALSELKTRPGMEAIVGALNQNPLPDAWIVRITPDPRSSPKDVVALSERLATEIRNQPKVDHVQVDSQWVERVEALLAFLRLGLAILAVTLAAAVIAIILNTVRLSVLTQREEIEVATLIGATHRFVRRPFYYAGALEGVAGGILALALVYASLVPLNRGLLDFAHLYGSSFQLAGPGALDTAIFLAIGAALGWIAAVLSVGRHMAGTLSS